MIAAVTPRVSTAGKYKLTGMFLVVLGQKSLPSSLSVYYVPYDTATVFVTPDKYHRIQSVHTQVSQHDGSKHF